MKKSISLFKVTKILYIRENKSEIYSLLDVTGLTL